jgi:PAT family beta-lactamase induction signal transducer AmpG
MNQNLAISENKALRLFMLFTLYVGQGLPIGLFFYAIPAWMADSGASVADIGYYSFIMALPWSLKFVNGFFLDRYVYLPMGRRRAWLLCAMLLMIIFLLLMALMSPSPSQLTLLSGLAFAVMFATTFQDAAIDGMAADLVPEDEQTISTGAMFGGQLIGIALGAAVTGYLISTAGFTISLFAMCAMVACIFLAALITRERPGEKILPWSSGQASTQAIEVQADNFKEIIVTVYRSVFKTDSLKLIAIMLLTSAAFGLYGSVMPKMSSELAGWSTQDYSSLSGSANLIAGILCVLVFGLLANKLGRKKYILILLLIQFAFACWALLDQSIWSTDAFVKTAGISVITIKYALSVATAAIAMNLCDIKVSATQFTLYMACSNLGLSLAYAMVGGLDALGGYLALISAFAAVTIISLIVAATLNVDSASKIAIEQ